MKMNMASNNKPCIGVVVSRIIVTILMVATAAMALQLEDPKHQQQAKLLNRMNHDDARLVTMPTTTTTPIPQRRRRQFLISAAFGITTFIKNQQPANAARGAAELDFEYYMRDLIGGNKKEGNVESSPLPTLPSPRTLRGPLLPYMLNKECTSSCIPTQVLLSMLSNNNESTIINQRMNEYRNKAMRGFMARAPYQTEDVTDQYYFDLTSYALWRTAASLLPNYADRDRFVRNIGRQLLDRILLDGKDDVVSTSKSVLQDTTPAIIALLDLFQASGYCKGYKIVGGDSGGGGVSSSSSSSSNTDPPIVFDELDDDSLNAGTSVDCLVSIYEPATLGASLQITGEQSRFIPDYVGTTLAAYWEKYGNIKTSWETFFIDPEYRPNPKDYFPNETLLQMTLRKK